MTPKQKSRLWRVLLTLGTAAILLAVYVAAFARRGPGLPCPLYALTGLQCPACGLTRAAAALMKWDFTAAFTYNALWPLWAGYVVWVTVADAAAYVRLGEIQILPGKRWIHRAVLAVAVGYGILRNFV